MVIAELYIRRYDVSDSPQVEKVVIDFDSNISCNDLQEKVMNACKINVSENKVLKLRNSDNMLIPYSMMLENVGYLKKYNIDITNITCVHNEGVNILQDTYMNSLQSKLRSIENRLEEAEMLLPQLEWKRQAHFEETASRLSNKVSFLNRRYDEIVPQQWWTKMPYTMA